MARKAGLKQII